MRSAVSDHETEYGRDYPSGDLGRFCSRTRGLTPTLSEGSAYRR